MCRLTSAASQFNQRLMPFNKLSDASLTNNRPTMLVLSLLLCTPIKINYCCLQLINLPLLFCSQGRKPVIKPTLEPQLDKHQTTRRPGNPEKTSHGTHPHTVPETSRDSKPGSKNPAFPITTKNDKTTSPHSSGHSTVPSQWPFVTNGSKPITRPVQKPPHVAWSPIPGTIEYLVTYYPVGHSGETKQVIDCMIHRYSSIESQILIID